MLRIGEFAELARVSIKMLRHYDAIGLLEPAHVDPATGYRSYTLDQLERTHRIVALRDLGFSLAGIQRILDDGASPGAWGAALAAMRDQVELRLADDQARLAAIEASLGLAAASTGGGPVVRRFDPQLVATRRVMDDAEPQFEYLEAEVARHRARATRPPMLVCHDRARTEVAIPLTEPIPAGKGIEVFRLPGAAAAISVIHRGDYGELEAIHAHLARDLAAWGLCRSGPLLILYHRFGADRVGYDLPAASLARHAGELVTELLIPVALRTSLSDPGTG